jgi:Fe-S oxidoreductase
METTTSTIKRAFIPGCSLPSYNPHAVYNILEYLQEKLPGTSAILKCCGKPTKSLGQIEKFKERYESFQTEVDRLEVTQLIVACQNCYMIMSEHSPNQKVRSLWEVLPEIGLPESSKGIGKNSDLVFGIQDSCPTRNVPAIHDGMRWIMQELGYKYVEAPNTREKTRCCGLGGMVSPANPDLALRVMTRRAEEFETDHVVTYCAACRESMVRGGKKSIHILDLIFDGPWTSKSEFPGTPATPLTSWKNRYTSKLNINKLYK